MSNNIKAIEQTLTELNAVQITDQQSLTEATSLLSKFNQLLDTITTEKEKLTKPLNQTLKEIRSRYKPLEDALNERISSIRHEMTRYQTEALKAKQAKEQAITEKLAEGKISLNKAVTALESLPETATKTVTDNGSISFREKQTLKVTDINKIAREYFDLNEARLLSDLKTGKLVPGAEIEIIQVPYNTR